MDALGAGRDGYRRPGRRDLRKRMKVGRWGRLRQEEAARLLGVCERSFRRYIDRYHEAVMEGLIDRGMAQISGQRGR